VEIEAEIVDLAERRLRLAALEHLVGEAVIVADKIVSEEFATGDTGEDGIQAEGAREDRLIIGDFPFTKFRLNSGWRVIHEICGKTLVFNTRLAEIVMTSDVLQTLFDPPDQVLADVEQHADLAVPALE